MSVEKYPSKVLNFLLLIKTTILPGICGFRIVQILSLSTCKSVEFTPGGGGRGVIP